MTATYRAKAPRVAAAEDARTAPAPSARTPRVRVAMGGDRENAAAPWTKTPRVRAVASAEVAR